MRKRRVDDNHPEVIQALRNMGWLVKSTAVIGSGFPDLLCVKAGRVVLIEVKDGRKPPSARKLTRMEEEAHREFKRFGVEVLVIEKLEDLAQLDRDARHIYEGVPPRNMYDVR